MEKTKQDLSVSSRRSFISQMALLSLATAMPPILWSCADDKSALYEGTGKPPFKVWEEMLQALQTSPDHLQARKDKLIASKDAKAMFDFVRDEIYLMPPEANSLRQLETKMKWGIKGALRYGFATPREKAELLNEMYTQAGISSQIVFENTAIKAEEVPAFFYRPVERMLNPDISSAQIKKWKKELQIDTEAENVLISSDPKFKNGDALAETVFAQLPDTDNLKTKLFDFNWGDNKTPTVAFEVEGVTKYAHLFDPTIPFGSLKMDKEGSTSNATNALANNQKIEIKISCRDAIHPKVEKELVSGSWLATDLVGNQIVLTFLNGLSLEEQTATPIGDVRLLTPALAFQGFDAPADFMEERSFLGNPFTLDGKTIDITGENIQVGESTLLEQNNPQLQKQVTNLEVIATPRGSPLIKLEITPTNANNDFVAGLRAVDFEITDNGIPVRALMESNKQTLRILFLYDTSGSMPKYYQGEYINNFASTLQKELDAIYPSLIVEKEKAESYHFNALLKASQRDYDLVVYLQDGCNNDAYLPENEIIYKSGPPAVILNVKDSKNANIANYHIMAEATNGVVIEANDVDNTVIAIKKYLTDKKPSPYIFTYYNAEITKEHEVVVHLDSKRLSAKDDYEVIDTVNYPVVENLIGLYLSVTINNRETKRVLAGWDPVLNKNIEPNFDHFKELRNTMLGGAIISFEGEGPTISAALSDVLKYRLSTKNWMEPFLDNDLEKAKKALQTEGSLMYNSLFVPLMAPLEGAVTKNTFTFASGIRIAILKIMEYP